MIDTKTLCLQEDFIRNNLITQIRILADKRSIKFKIEEDFDYAS